MEEGGDADGRQGSGIDGDHLSLLEVKINAAGGSGDLIPISVSPRSDCLNSFSAQSLNLGLKFILGHSFFLICLYLDLRSLPSQSLAVTVSHFWSV